MNQKTAERRVANGAEFFDEHIPGWRKVVNPYALDIGNNDGCVTACLFGTFEQAQMLLDLSWREAIMLGLAVNDTQARRAQDADYDLLTAEWKRVLGVETVAA